MITEGTTVKVTGSSKWAHMGTWVVLKVNPAKYKLGLSTDRSVVLNAPKYMVEEVSGPQAQASGPKRPDGLRTGAVVRLSLPVAEFDEFTLFVIIKDEVTQVSVVPLGGDDKGRYWKVAPGRLEVVKLGG